MSEIEKLYKNAGVGYLMYVVATFPPVDYPQIDFTAEKQLSLIKWLCQNKGYTMLIKYINSMNSWRIECNFNGVILEGSFEECFAYLLNDRWQDLTEEEKQQVKGILE